MTLDGQWDMSHCFTLVTVVVEGTRFGDGVAILAVPARAGKTHWWSEQKFRNGGMRFGALVVLNFDQTPNACAIRTTHDYLRANLNAHQACKR